MRMRVRSLDPMSVGKTMAAIYGAMSLLFVPIFVILMIVGAVAGANEKSVPFAGALGIGFGLILIIVLPLLYALIAFVMGALMALIYNLASRWMGGVIMELVPENLSAAARQTSEPPYPLVPPSPGGANV